MYRLVKDPTTNRTLAQAAGAIQAPFRALLVDMSTEKSEDQGKRPGWGRLFGGGGKRQFSDESKTNTPKWSMGVLNDWETVEVPGQTANPGFDHGCAVRHLLTVCCV